MTAYIDPAYSVPLLDRVRERCRLYGPTPEPMMTPTALERLHEHPGRYDPRRWLELFPHLAMQEGWVLDFVFAYWGNGGVPRVYARRSGEPRRGGIAAPADARETWDAKVRCDGSAEGFFCDRASLRAALGEPTDEPQSPFLPPGTERLTRKRFDDLLALEVRPRVQVDSAEASVTLLSMGRPGGLAEETYAVRADLPVRRTAQTMLWERRGGPIH